MKKVLFAASECVPFVKTGGLADVVGALPKEFDKAEWDIRVIYANTKVREDIGCAALQRGPVVYAFEGVDNGDDVQSLLIDVSRLNEAQVETEAEGMLKGAVLLDIPAVRLEGSDALYSEEPPRQKSVIARAIPYYMWGNRGLNQMRVWMQRTRYI